MSTIAVIGATGYAGGHIVRIARERGHEVIGVSRSAPETAEEGVEYRQGSIEDEALVDRLFADADVIVVSVPARVDGRRDLTELVPGLLAAAAAHDTRLGVVGGAGSLHTTSDGPRLLDTPEFPAEFHDEAQAHAQALEALRDADTTADWFYVSPAPTFGAWAEGERTGRYRVGEDTVLPAEDGGDGGDGKSIGGADFAIAFLDEIEQPAHRRVRFTVAD